MEHLTHSYFRSAGSTREKRLCMQMIVPENADDVSAAEKFIQDTPNAENLGADGMKRINELTTSLEGQALSSRGTAALQRILQLRRTATSAREFKEARDQHAKNLKELENLAKLAVDAKSTEQFVKRVHEVLHGYFRQIREVAGVDSAERPQNQMQFIEALTQWAEEFANEATDTGIDIDWSPTYNRTPGWDKQQAAARKQASADYVQTMSRIASTRKQLAAATDRTEALWIRSEIRQVIDYAINQLMSATPASVVNLSSIDATARVWDMAPEMIRDNLQRIAQLRKELVEVDAIVLPGGPAKEDPKPPKTPEAPKPPKTPEEPKPPKDGEPKPPKDGEPKPPKTEEKPKETNEKFFQQILKFLEQILILLRANATTPTVSLEGPQKALNNLMAQRTKLTTELNEITAKITAAGGLPGAVTGNAALIALNTQHANIQKQIENIDKQIATQTQIAPLNQQCVKQHCGFMFAMDACGRIICYQTVSPTVSPIAPAMPGIMTPFNQFVRQCQPLGCQMQMIGGMQVGCMPPSQLPAIQQMMSTMPPTSPMIAPGYGANFVNQVQVIVNNGNGGATIAKNQPIYGRPGPAGSAGKAPTV